jgi:hypothetical protein
MHRRCADLARLPISAISLLLRWEWIVDGGECRGGPGTLFCGTGGTDTGQVLQVSRYTVDYRGGNRSLEAPAG